jgi:hypothetical protein
MGTTRASTQYRKLRHPIFLRPDEGDAAIVEHKIPATADAFMGTGKVVEVAATAHDFSTVVDSQSLAVPPQCPQILHLPHISPKYGVVLL